MTVVIFYTNITAEHDVQRLAPALENIPGIIRWTVDLDDSDKVLRVVALSDIASDILQLLQAHGYCGWNVPVNV